MEIGKYGFITLSVLFLALTSLPLNADVIEDHKEMKGPFKTPRDVTKACLECHEDAAPQVKKTSHWTWDAEQNIGDKGNVRRGKKTLSITSASRFKATGQDVQVVLSVTAGKTKRLTLPIPTILTV